MTAVRAPLPGVVQALSECPDPVFSSQLLGAGVGIIPALSSNATHGSQVAGELVVASPLSGTVEACLMHAFVVDGVLVHLGVDSHSASTFRQLHHKGDVVKVGQPMILWDVASHRAQNLPLWAGIVTLDHFQSQLEVNIGDTVSAGQLLLSF